MEVECIATCAKNSAFAKCLAAIRIDAFSALRSLLTEHQPRQRARAALLQWSSELGRLTWPLTLKQWYLETSHRPLAAAKNRAA